jgi:hypothetical protein
MTAETTPGQAVAPFAWEEPDTLAQMASDCRAAGVNLRLDRVGRAALRPSPSILFQDFPRDLPKREIQVPEAARRIADALHLHLD